MKRYGHLYENVCSFEALLAAAHRARKGKRFKPGCRDFFFELEREILRLERELKSQTYLPGRYRSFKIYEGKERVISAAPFRDRVVHHALVAVLEPIFERSFIYDSYANRLGKGTHRAVDRFTAFARKRCYVLKCDVWQFFPSVDHEILMGLLEHKIKDPKLIWLVRRILRGWQNITPPLANHPGNDLFSQSWRRRGLPIGNLTSQFWANVYLNPLDHFVKDTLRCRHYIRYMDDFVLFSNYKSSLGEWRRRIIGFMKSLRLRLHENRAQVWPVACGTDFLGYVVFPDHRRVRRSNVARFRRRLRKMVRDYGRGEMEFDRVNAGIQSWVAHASHADSYTLRAKILGEVVFARKGQVN